MTTQEKYADKIAKLLAKAESTKSQEEAEALFGKAQELMTQYAIDEAMIAAAAGFSSRSSEIVEEEFVTVGIYRFALSDMLNRILKVNDAQVVLLSGAGSRTIDGRVFKQTVVFRAVGYKNDLDRARALNASLMLQAIRSENAWWEENKHQYAWMKSGDQHKQRRQFLFSFGYAIHARLEAAKVRGTATAKQEHGTGMELVLRDKSQMVLEKFNALYPDLRDLHSRVQGGGYEAGQAGRAAGERADVGQPGVGGSKKELN